MFITIRAQELLQSDIFKRVVLSCVSEEGDKTRMARGGDDLTPLVSQPGRRTTCCVPGGVLAMGQDRCVSCPRSRY